jgi:chromosome segregation ATPase
VRTLEGHVATLRERLEEATAEETDRQAPRPPPRLVIEQPSGVQQREDAEQLRLEADSRWLDLDRRNRAEIDRLNRRLGDSERDARGLAERLRGVERDLATSECLLERMRRGHRQLEALLREMRTLMSGLSAVVGGASTDAAPEPFENELNEARIRAYRLGRENRAQDGKPTTNQASAAAVAANAPHDPRAEALDAALAVAVERLRSRAGAGTGVERTAEGGSPETSTPVSMSPSREPLLASPRVSWWAAWRARLRGRRHR